MSLVVMGQPFLRPCAAGIGLPHLVPCSGITAGGMPAGAVRQPGVEDGKISCALHAGMVSAGTVRGQV